MIRNAARRSAVKLSVAAVIATAAASVAPAQAVISTPVPLGNTVPLGYTNTNLGVAMTYNSVLDASASNVVVTDVNGAPVAGSSLISLTDERTLVFQTTSSSRFNEDLSPYTATFTARANRQAANTASSIQSLTFDVDFITPFPPNVRLNDGVSTTPFVVAGPEDALVINGEAADTLAPSGIASGVRKVDIHFYNPTQNPHQITTGGTPEVDALHKTITFACNPACGTSESLSIDLAAMNLPAGYWNVRVSVTDAAGNRSAQGEALRFLKLTAPN